jgi:hypothetical protein
MSETAIRELLSRAVGAGPPAGIQLPVDDVLARNGRVLRRRRIGRSAAAVVLLAGAAGLFALLPGRPPSAPPAPPATTVSPAPTGPAADYRSRAMAALDLLTAAVPAGYTMPARDAVPRPDSASFFPMREVTWRSPEQSRKELYAAWLEVQLDGRAALLTVRVTDEIPPGLLWSADLCATPVAPREQVCQVVTATDGTPVRIASWQPVTGPVRQAVRVANGVLVTVEQASRPRPGVYGLGRAVLTDRQLADLAADPALLP